MNITPKKVLAQFFPNPSFEFIYSEAVANAIDAGATRIIKCGVYRTPRDFGVS